MLRPFEVDDLDTLVPLHAEESFFWYPLRRGQTRDEAYRVRGFVTEAGAVAIAFGFTTLGLDRIVSIFEPENVASGRVINRLGFILERVTAHPTSGAPLHVRELARERWMAMSAKT